MYDDSRCGQPSQQAFVLSVRTYEPSHP